LKIAKVTAVTVGSVGKRRRLELGARRDVTTAGETGPTIWVDDDATPRPIKEVLFKTSMRRGTPLVLVSNRWTQPPKSGNVRCIQVEQGADVADDTIVELVQRGDLVITNDIPLAARVVEKGAEALRPKGNMLDAENVREQLSLRDFSEDLRSSGLDSGGPPPFGPADKQRFANALDRWLARTANRR